MGDGNAAERIARHVSRPSPRAALHEAQLTIAREQGFASWPRFRAFLRELSLDPQGLGTQFVQAALGDLRGAEEMLARHPDIASAGFYSALVMGDVERVERALAEWPAMAGAKGGPRNWEPLVYVCFSRFASARSARAGGLAETARVLLRHGADPNTFYLDDRWADNPLPCLYGAAGLNNNPALARVLLEAGARPNDSESLYHSTEHPDLACMRLLLEYGASPHGTNALKHMLDTENIEGLRLLLAAGADANEVNGRGETALHWAVWRGRGPEIVTALIDAGAALDTHRNDGRTAYALAVQSGQTGTAALLARRGANTDISAFDRLVGAYAADDSAKLSQVTVAREGPLPEEYERLLPEFAAGHRTAAVRGLLAAGIAVDARGEHGGTALHWACWKGYADLVKILLAHGASLTIEDEAFHAPPAGWFSHGLQNCAERDGDYPETARLLLAAGATIAAGDIPSGDEAVDAVLREYGLI